MRESKIRNAELNDAVYYGGREGRQIDRGDKKKGGEKNRKTKSIGGTKLK